MYEVISGLLSYHDISYNENLAIEICQELRPKFNIKVPQLIVHLIKRCLDANSLNRPTIGEIYKILYPWHDRFRDQKELQEQIKEVDKINEKLSTSNAEKISVNIYFDLLDQSIKDYKLNHGLSYLLTEKIREYGWVDMDFKDKEILHQYSKIISTIANNLSDFKLDGNDPILSGIIDVEHIKANHSIINKKVGEEDWKNFSDINLKIKDFPNGIRTKWFVF
ncbi:uncharacterized protein OCT59_016607 [Rhizophagus irregularis]|uniref:uncharacterized protein n=1 Tax=Rhizophagus irregularis TaxID=588596 RepID=UPI00332D975E|nr:hypothetical protein OCT59_016607 [Rhizophagus irregularis]